MEEALQQVKNVVFANSLEESQRVYETWSESYDKDVNAIGWIASHEAAKMFQKYAMDTELLLDIGGGTGIVIELLRKAGYQGTVDILDANLSMLEKGAKKNLNLRNIIRHYIQENGDLFMKDELYDAVVSAGAFVNNHIPASALKGIIKVVKKGGLIIVTTRSTSTVVYKSQFDRVVDELKDEGKIELVDEYEFPHYVKIDEDIKSVVYVFKKLL